MFAGDVKLYVKMVNDVGISTLQAELSVLVCWAENWQLYVSVRSKQMGSLTRLKSGDAKPLDPVDALQMHVLRTFPV